MHHEQRNPLLLHWLLFIVRFSHQWRAVKIIREGKTQSDVIISPLFISRMMFALVIYLATLHQVHSVCDLVGTCSLMLSIWGVQIALKHVWNRVSV